jgi:hypothetical protein
MENSSRYGFDKGGERYTDFTCTVESLLWRIVFEIVLHVLNFRTVLYSWSEMMSSSNKCYILNMISKHLIRNTMKLKRA